MLSGSVGDKATPPYRIFGGSSAVYQPLEFFPWWFWFDAYAPHIFVESHRRSNCDRDVGLAGSRSDVRLASSR
jgi:hypothetical protein